MYIRHHDGAFVRIGQKLYCVPALKALPGREVVVTAIGRKWVTLDNNERFAIADARMMLDGGGYASPGRCYLSKADYEAEQVVKRRWASLVRWIEKHRYGPPHGMTVERIEKASDILQDSKTE